MTLVSCPECQCEISDLAAACPHCGARSHVATPQAPQPEKFTKRDAAAEPLIPWRSILWIVGAPVAIVGIAAFSVDSAVFLWGLAGLIAALSIAIPIRRLLMPSRAIAFLTMISLAAIAGPMDARQAQVEEARIEALRLTDPSAYAEAVAARDEAARVEKERADARKKARAEAVAAAAKKRREADAPSHRRGAAPDAETRRKGFHCLSAWDGSHPEFRRSVKSRMRNPKSFEHIETRAAPVSGGRHTIIMTFRAENGFGGMTVGQAVGSYSNSDCSATILSIE